MKTGCTYQELEHTAEIGVRVRAPNQSELYACAALAMFKLLHAEINADVPAVDQLLSIDAIDAESLMVNWLSELLYIHAITGSVIAACDILAWSPTRLDAHITTCPTVDAPAMEIKAVTYHQLVISDAGGEWMAEVYFDI